MLSEGGEENSIYHPFVARFNPIQARGGGVFRDHPKGFCP